MDIFVTIICQNTETQNLENHCDVGKYFYVNFVQDLKIMKLSLTLILSLIASYSLKFKQKNE